MVTYGGGANPPVRLDPWQNIAGVGWPGDYLTVFVGIDRDDTLGQDDLCTPLVDPGGARWSDWIDQLGWAYTNPANPATVTVHTKTGTAPASGAEVSGVPSLPAPQSFSRFEWAGISAPVWIDPGGSAIAVPGYGSLDGLYRNLLAAQMQRSAQPFLSDDTTCSGPTGLPGQGFPAAPVAAHPQLHMFTDGAATFGTGDISATGLSVAFEGRIYLPIGIRLVSSFLAIENGTSYDGLDGLSVLLQRQTS